MKRINVLCILLMISGIARAITYPFTTVDTPGFHILYTNVSNQITISVSDVTLDLNGATVSGGTNGIVINSGLNNVTIKNGAINSVSSNGIQVGAGCSDITLQDITVSNAIRGVSFSQVTNGLLRNCDMQQSTTGLMLDACHNIVLENCTARANTHAGYDLLRSTTCSLLECSALSTGNGNSSISSQVFGFVAKDGNGNIFERCIANATQALSVTGDNSIVAGFALRGSESCTTIIDSEGSNSQTNVNGFTIPYGILLETTIDSTQSMTGLAGIIQGIDWSPDGKYIAVGGGDGSSGGSNDPLQIFLFDQIGKTVTSVAGALPSIGGGSIESLSWSPDGNYIAVVGFLPDTGAMKALQVLSFDNSSITLQVLDGALDINDFISAVDWSSSGDYIAIGGSIIAGGTTNDFQIFQFDRATGRLSSITGVLSGGFGRTVAWSPDDAYIALGGSGLTGDELQIYRFNKAARILTSVTSVFSGSSNVRSVAWSPDGNYLAAGGATLTGGTNDELQVFLFDRAGGTLTSIAGILSGEVYSVRWSADGKYIAIAGDTITGGTGDEYQIIKFDRAAGTLTAITGGLAGSSARGIAWSRDGSAIAIGGNPLSGGSGLSFQIFSGFGFPQKNVIKGNTMYCNSGGRFPSGVGISAPSISNLVIGNTAFNNPIPRAANKPIIVSNYHFVTNVFNPLFGEGPSSLQNIATSALTPLPTVPDVPAKIKRTELLLESLIDNLL